MLGAELNGLRLKAAPEAVSGHYPFKVMESYYGKGRGGRDLTVSYTYWLPQAEVRFNPFDFEGESGVVLAIKAGAFDELGSNLRLKGANDFAIYPGFGGTT